MRTAISPPPRVREGLERVLGVVALERSGDDLGLALHALRRRGPCPGRRGRSGRRRSASTRARSPGVVLPMPISPPTRTRDAVVLARVGARACVPTLIAWRDVLRGRARARWRGSALGFRPVWTTSRCVVSAFTPASTQISSAPVSRASVGHRAAAGQEGREHLRGDLGRVGAHALGRDAVVGGRDDDAGLDRRPRLPGHAREPDRELLEPPEAARRLDRAGAWRARAASMAASSSGWISTFTGGACIGAVDMLRRVSREGAGKPVRDRRGRATVTGRVDPGSQNTVLRGPSPTGRVIPRRSVARSQYRSRLMRRLSLVRHALHGRGPRRRLRGRRTAWTTPACAAASRLRCAAAARGEVLVSPAAPRGRRPPRGWPCAVDAPRWPSATSAPGPAGRWRSRRGRPGRVGAWMTDPDAAPARRRVA